MFFQLENKCFVGKLPLFCGEKSLPKSLEKAFAEALHYYNSHLGPQIVSSIHLNLLRHIEFFSRNLPLDPPMESEWRQPAYGCISALPEQWKCRSVGGTTNRQCILYVTLTLISCYTRDSASPSFTAKINNIIGNLGFQVNHPAQSQTHRVPRLECVHM